MTADYDDWAEETPDREQRLTELVTQLAEYLGLSVGPAKALEPTAQSVVVLLKCGLCGGIAFMGNLRIDPGTTWEVQDMHVCMAGASAATGQQPAFFPFTLAVRNAT